MKKFNDEILRSARQSADPLADNFIKEALSFGKEEVKALRSFIKGQSSHAEVPLLLAFEKQVFRQMPGFYDVKSSETAVRVFRTYAREIMSLLGSLSLPYCYAAADGARVLYFSDKIRNNTHQRLTDTAAFIFDVFESADFERSETLRAAILRTRLIHAFIRHGLLKSGKWDDEKWGLPVNQEDMAGTNLAFSHLIIRGLRKLNRHLSADEAIAFRKHWAVVGYFLGINEVFLVWSASEANALEEAIVRHTFKVSEEGQALTAALLTAYGEIIPAFLPTEYPAAMMRYLLGNHTADILGLPEGHWSDILVEPLKLFNYFQTERENRLEPGEKIRRLKAEIFEASY